MAGGIMLRRLAVLRPVAQRALLRHERRCYATDKQPGPTAQFYKTFTRPVAKVLLMAVLTYQVVYYGWTRLETDELRAEADETLKGLEAQVEEYKAKATPKKS
ncbi:hypothetical protein NLU13_1712 [Sarocladium strictum]|uniref:Uncharacterized protein n=1 Tax=Sarocladium strictum TaxID=5046 RepID=A0AA39GRG5_SARSR|nr:hypothetical protein NLU13_1712 [Sarocladium strictum]